MKGKRLTNQKLIQITRFMFVATLISALLWVNLSYLIALYATVRLGQPFPLETLSGDAVTAILGVTALKVIENIFEHNDGGLFGHSKAAEQEETV